MKKRAGKKSLSRVKRKNITHNKLAKQGVLNKDAKRKRSKENRKEKRRTYNEHLQETRRKEANMEPEQEITGQEMMEMMDADDLQILMNANSTTDNGKKRRIEDIEKEGREFEDYKAMKTKDGRELMQCLPIVTDEGVESKLALKSKERRGLALKRFKRTNEEPQQDEDSGIGDGDEDEEEFEKVETVFETEGGEKSVTQILAERKRYLHEQKVKMACLALNVVQDPTKLTNLRFLLNMLKTLDLKADVTVFKYSLCTILQVFHDLIPGYRIQENTLDNKMKKDKYLTARQELDFIEYYRGYLKALEQVLSKWKADKRNLGLTVLSETAVFCLGDLVVRHPYFNYTVNIIQALVPHLNTRNDKIRKLVFDALTYTIKHDKNFYLSLEVVRRIYKMTHRLGFKVKDDVLKVFLSLRVSEMRNSDQVLEQQKFNTNAFTHKEKLVKKLTENFRQKTSRKQKREKKKMAKINKQMESINVAEMKNVENERHTEVIQTVFGLYIHVLKRRASSKLMSTVLEGLAKFAHLVNIDFFSDLLALMNQFLEEKTLGRRESLHCIQTVFKILSGQGEALNVDPHRFYNQFYKILMELNLYQFEENIETIIDILEQMLLQRRKKVSTSKVLSYAKRIATLSLSLPHNIAIPILVKLKKLFTMFSSTEALLDPDPEGCPGMFLPDIEDPEHANSAATAVWEMILCQRSYHPQVGILAKNILSGIPTREVPAVHSVTERSTKKLLQDFDQSNNGFNPDLPEPSTHLKSVKRKMKKQFFQKGDLDLENFKLQSICEKVLEDEDKNGDKYMNTNSRKDKNKDLLNFYENIFNAKENKRSIVSNSVISGKKDFTQELVEIK